MRRSLSVAALVLPISFAVFHTTAREQSGAEVFQLMQQKLRGISTYSYTNTVSVPPQKVCRRSPINRRELKKLFGKSTDDSCKVEGVYPDWTVLTRQKGTGEEFTLISNRLSDILLRLYPDEKHAVFENITDLPAGAPRSEPGFPESLAHLEYGEVTFLGRELRGDLLTYKYEERTPWHVVYYWIDPNEYLPTYMLTDEIADCPGVKSISSDFAWNPTLDQSRFTLEPPQGYTSTSLTEHYKGEQSFAAAMGCVVRLQQGKFPARLGQSFGPSLYAFGGICRTRAELSAELANALQQPASPDTSQRKMEHHFQKVSLRLETGSRFLKKVRDQQNWHYQGNGVELGDADKVVAWWHPKAGTTDSEADPTTARVLYGDLRIESLPVADLPNAE